MDSPDQNAKGIPVDSVSYADKSLYIGIKKLGASYTGEYDSNTNTFKGSFTQMGFKIPLSLTKSIPEKEQVNRPQEPKAPFPYAQKEVFFTNGKDSVELAGTLTIPNGKGPFPAVVLVSGSGPQNRDEELLGHKPFLVIADYLTRNGIAVLRYDDRGVGKSSGKFSTSTTNDFANDASAAISYLGTQQNINSRRIGIIGHSEGGIIAYIEAARNKKVAFIISLAGPTIPGDEILMQQSALIAKAAGSSDEAIASAAKINRTIYDIVIKEKDITKMRQDVEAAIEKSISQKSNGTISSEQKATMARQQAAQITSPWFVNFLRYDPRVAISKIKVPLLFLVGEKDYQVPAKSNISSLKEVVAANKMKNITIKEIPGANHLFQKCQSCTVSEYGKLEETFNPEVLLLMVEWINQR